MTAAASSHPDVSIVIPNWNGVQHLERCFATLQLLAYPGHVEQILVDNGSTDGSVQYMAKRFPRVRVLKNEVNTGFAAAVNRGAREANGKIVAFMNNDMRVDPSWLSELVKPIVEKKARCTASLILSWDGTRVNYGGGGMNFHGIGIQLGMDDADIDRWKKPGDTLFACGGAMAIDRGLFLDVDGFDEDFFAYYEDVDLGWRLWVLGETVRYVPTSITYHHHSATSRRIDVHRLRLLQIRNPLLSIFKNYDDENVERALPAAILLTLRRTKYLLALDENEFTLAGNRGMKTGPFASLRARGAKKLPGKRVPMAGLADVLAINEVMTHFDKFAGKRRRIQEARKRPDKEILPLFVDPFWPAERSDDYSRLSHELTAFFGVDKMFAAKKRAH